MNTGGIDPLSKLPYVPGATYDAQQHNHGCLENARVDILADLDSWAQDQKTHPVYWLAGMAGTGKSTIAWSFCEHLASKNLLGGSFFCSRGGPAAHSDVTRVLPTLARLLAMVHDDFRVELEDHLKQNPDAAYKSIDSQIMLFLRRPLTALSSQWPSRPVFVFVIDALDECSDRDATVDMLHALIELSSFLHPLKFFVTSRPEHHIRGTPLSDYKLSRIMKLHEIDPSTVDADIRLFVQIRLSAIRNSGEAWYNNNDIVRLTELSNGLFIFASTAISYIRGGNSAERLHKVVSSTVQPGGPATKPLDNMYQIILEGTLNPDALELNELAFLKGLLSSILSMRTTLSVCALAELLSVLPWQLRGHLDLLHAVISIPDDNMSPGLKTLHASFGDFLTERAPNHMRIDKSAGHEQLLDACFRRMSQDDLCFNISKTPSSYFPHPNPEAIADDISETLRYACLHWPHHLNSMSTPLLFIPGIERIFCPKFLFWLELLGVLGCIEEASDLILTVIRTIEPVSNDISFFMSDALAFLKFLQFGGHWHINAPHLYLSALPSTPSNSRIFKAFYHRFKQLPQMQSHGINVMARAALLGREPDDSVNSITFSPGVVRLMSSPDDQTTPVLDAGAGAELLSSLPGHDGSVLSVAFSPDGARIVSGSRDETIRIWDAHTGAELMPPLTGHHDSITSVVFSSDGTRIVSGSYDSTIRLWDAHTGAQLLPPLTGHDCSVFSVAFSPDGARIVSSSEDKTIRVWDAHTGSEVLLPLTGHDDWIFSAAFSPDGACIVSGSGDSTIRLWDAHTGAELLSPLSGHNGWVLSVAFSPDGTRVVSGSDDGTIRVWDAHTGTEVIPPLTGHGDWVHSVAFSPDGMHIASCSRDKKIRIWNVHTGSEMILPLIGHDDYVHSIAFSPDGTRIASGSDDQTIRVWDIPVACIEPLPSSMASAVVWDCSRSDDWTWITGRSGELLFWIPWWYRTCTLFRPCTSIIGKCRVVIDFTSCGSAHGAQWTQCFVG